LLTEGGTPRDALTLIDARAAADAESDPRLIALSEASRGLLERLGAWPMDSAAPIQTIHVSQRGRFGRTLIERSDYDLAALGYVVRYGELARAMNGATAKLGLDVRRPARLLHCEALSGEVQVTLADGPDLDAAYVVHAEGGLFERQSPLSIRRDYRQTAITGVVRVAHPRVATAFERFTEEGPLALLPAHRSDPSQYALVWCCTPEAALRRSGLDEARFLEELHAEFGDRLGRFLGVGERATFALGLNAREDVARFREFAIGNAAQTLHPVAGQGLNLGLRDAFILAGLLLEHRDAPLTCMQRFGAARRLDRTATLNLTDLLPRVFASKLLPVAALRGAALAFLDLVGPARHVLARQMMQGQR
jgi:2-octaprenyl-6-methoxyphenol hydroxylase